MKKAVEKDVYNSSIEELKSVAYTREFYLNGEEDPLTEETVSDRTAPGFWNALLIFSYAEDLKCPNADYFRRRLALWVPQVFKQYRTALVLNENSRIQLRAGCEWADILQKLKPTPQTHNADAQKMLNDHYNNANKSQAESLQYWTSWYQRTLTSLNETMDRFEKSNSPEFAKD